MKFMKLDNEIITIYHLHIHWTIATLYHYFPIPFYPALDVGGLVRHLLHYGVQRIKLHDG